MFMNSLIHLLEVTTLILVGVLIVQVYRCYLNFTRAEQAQGELTQVEATVRSMSVRINISSSGRTATPSLKQKTDEVLATDFKMPVTDAETTQLELKSRHAEKLDIDARSQEPALVSKSNLEGVNSNGQILNDYIGEFFAEPERADIEAYKLESARGGSIDDVPITPVESSVEMSEPLTDQDKDEVIVVESHCKIQPVILESDELDLDSLPILTEIATIEEPEQLEDDSIITVMSQHDNQQSNAKVMSDKVVHAMLDEARLVCVS